MDTLTARPKLLKQANLSLIRKTIRAKGTASRAEIVNETKISFTTVRSLLIEMLQNGEIDSIGYDESTGGRKAERYRLKPNRYYGAVFCITDSKVYAILANVYGEVIEKKETVREDGNLEKILYTFLDEMIEQRDIKSVGVGVPGVVEDGCYWIKDVPGGDLRKIDIGDRIFQKYGIPVILENDLNATAIGYGRWYERTHLGQAVGGTNMAYLHFGRRCVSAGFITGDRVIRGCNNFAGELGFVPMEDGSSLDQHVCRPISDTEFVMYTCKIVAWICGILNPEYIVLSGSELRINCISAICDRVNRELPEHMCAKILYSSDVRHDYFTGMAYLTARKMFDEVQFIRDQINEY